MMTINDRAVVVGAVVTIDVGDDLTVTSYAKGELVMAETKVDLLRIGRFDGTARWHEMTATSLSIEYLLRH